VKLVKQQINGNERVVLKEAATPEDLRAEVARLRSKFGYEIHPDQKPGRFIATHSFYRGKYILALEPE
jgi:hypothetical protein